jgi:hypothetical protein
MLHGKIIGFEILYRVARFQIGISPAQLESCNRLIAQVFAHGARFPSSDRFGARNCAKGL